MPVLTRPSIAYDPDRICGYVPGTSRWLSAAARQQMIEAARGYRGLDADQFILDLTLESSRLEGCTLTGAKAAALIDGGDLMPGIDPTHAALVLNHERAASLMLNSISTETLDVSLMRRVHSVLMRDLLDADQLGRIRSEGSAVRIAGSSYVSSSDSAQLFHGLASLCRVSREIEDPFEAAFFVLAAPAYLQAFAAGNKRLGRVMCNMPLLRAGLPPISFASVSAGEYSRAMIAFFESGDADPLSSVIAKAYAQDTRF